MRMLRFLGEKASDRKKNLFAAACFRRIWQLLPDQPSREAVGVLEHYADGQTTADALAAARVRAWASAMAVPSPTGNRTPASLAAVAVSRDNLRDMVMDAAEATAWVKVGTPEATSAPEEKAQCDLIRDIFGNAFGEPPLVAPSLLKNNHSIILKLAQAAYEERSLPDGRLDKERLAVLADALEAAGADAALVSHLRESGGVHVRGCYLVDCLLGKS